MWRPKPRFREYLRLGRHAAERWAGEGAPALVARHAWPDDAVHDGAAWAVALHALFTTRPQAPVTVLLESAWMPMMLLETGSAVLPEAQVQTLLRHRLGLLHGAAALADWELRTLYRPGDATALGYALPGDVRQRLASAAAALPLEWAAWLPAFAWGLEHLQPARSWPRRSGWWLWPEQDRTLVARLAGKQVVALNAAAAPAAHAEDQRRLVNIEAARTGWSGPAPAAAGQWTPIPSMAVVA